MENNLMRNESIVKKNVTEDFWNVESIRFIPRYGATEFLKFLYQSCDGGSINLRFLPSTKNLFIPLSEIDSIPAILEVRKGENIFFGIATRRKGDGTKDGIIEIPVLLVDLDTYKLSNEEREETRQRYKDFPLKATFEINSGGGRYLLWVLKDSATQEDIPHVENITQRLISFFHGDPQAKDASRIIRVVGSINHKYPDKPIVTIESFHLERQYSLSDFEEILPEVEQADRPLALPTLPQFFGDYSDADSLLVEVLKHAHLENRSDTAFNFFRQLRDSGMSQDEAAVYAVLFVKRVDQSGHPYDVAQAMATLKSAYRKPPMEPKVPSIEKIAKWVDNITDFSKLSEQIPTLLFVEDSYKEKVRKSAQHTCRKAEKDRTDVSFPLEGNGRIISMPRFAKQWECAGCAKYLRDEEKRKIRIVHPRGFYPVVLSPYDDRNDSDRRSYDYLMDKISRAGGTTYGIVSPTKQSAVILSNIPVKGGELADWENGEADKILDWYLCHEPEGLNGMKKIRPSKRFMEKLRASGEYGEESERKSDGNRGTLTISASPEEVAECLMKLGCEEVFIDPQYEEGERDTVSPVLSDASESSPKRNRLVRVFRPSKEALELLRAKYHSDPNKLIPIFDVENCLNFAYRPGRGPVIN
jgi:hypothetical protein